MLKWHTTLFNKATKLAHHTKMYWKKNHIKFIYHFVKYNNRQTCITFNVILVDICFLLHADYKSMVFIYSHFRIMAHKVSLFLSSSHQEWHLLSRERPAPSCRLPTPWSVKEHYFKFILKSASNRKFLYTSFIYFQK